MTLVTVQLVPPSAAAICVDLLGGFEVPDGVADVGEKTLGPHVGVAGSFQRAVHATLSEGHSSGDSSATLSGENCWLPAKKD